MTVAELIAELQTLPQNLPVHFAYNASDYRRTIVAPEVQKVELGITEYSPYHKKPKVLDPEEAGDTGEDTILLS